METQEKLNQLIRNSKIGFHININTETLRKIVGFQNVHIIDSDNGMNKYTGCYNITPEQLLNKIQESANKGLNNFYYIKEIHPNKVYMWTAEQSNDNQTNLIKNSFIDHLLNHSDIKLFLQCYSEIGDKHSAGLLDEITIQNVMEEVKTKILNLKSSDEKFSFVDGEKLKIGTGLGNNNFTVTGQFDENQSFELFKIQNSNDDMVRITIPVGSNIKFTDKESGKSFTINVVPTNNEE